MVGIIEMFLESGTAWMPDMATAISTLCCHDTSVSEKLVPYFEVVWVSIFG
jgi:hypothetical protein